MRIAARSGATETTRNKAAPAQNQKAAKNGTHHLSTPSESAIDPSEKVGPRARWKSDCLYSELRSGWSTRPKEIRGNAGGSGGSEADKRKRTVRSSVVR
jgi:hypothetical protein